MLFNLPDETKGSQRLSFLQESLPPSDSHSLVTPLSSNFSPSIHRASSKWIVTPLGKARLNNYPSPLENIFFKEILKFWKVFFFTPQQSKCAFKVKLIDEIIPKTHFPLALSSSDPNLQVSEDEDIVRELEFTQNINLD